MNTLYFEKISQFDRVHEPVSVSIPFAKSIFTDTKHLIIRDEETTYPVQTRPLAHWDDGSVKWLLAHFQPNLPGNKDKTLHFDIADSPPESVLSHEIALMESDDGYHVDTGVLQFDVPKNGFYPVTNVKLHDESLWGDTPLHGFDLTVDGKTYTTTDIDVTLELEEVGSLKIVILVHGKHRSAGGVELFELHGRITAYAGKTYVEVEHQFIHTEDQPEHYLDGLTLKFAPGKSSVGTGCTRSGILSHTD